MAMPVTPVIGLTIPMTSHGQKWVDYRESYLINIFLPSFMETYSPEYNYRFYLGIDEDDPLFSRLDQQNAIKEYFEQQLHLTPEFVIFRGIEKGYLTKMWNILAMKAYLDHCDYFYFCGDDILFLHQGWVEQCVITLIQHRNFGITGPVNKNGNVNILTQIFVSRYHLDIFGYAFPEEIKNWYLDDWINLVYSPCYVYRLENYHCYNQGGKERYNIVDANNLCRELVIRDRVKVQHYIHR